MLALFRRMWIEFASIIVVAFVVKIAFAWIQNSDESLLHIVLMIVMVVENAIVGNRIVRLVITCDTIDVSFIRMNKFWVDAQAKLVPFQSAQQLCQICTVEIVIVNAQNG